MSPTTYTAAGRLVAVDRMRNSTSGNPRYRVAILGTDGAATIAETEPDAAFAYDLPAIGADVRVTYRRTARARLVVDLVEFTEPEAQP